MKKKLILFILLIAIIICAAGCKNPENSYKREEVPTVKKHFTGIPDYSLSENASTDEIRAMAVKAMRDELTVPWYSREDIRYNKTGPGSDKVFRFKQNYIYCGLPYTNSNTGLLHWLQYYDFNTGEFKTNYGGNINRELGNACAVSVSWGWSAVANSINWHFCNEMVPKNGVFQVGDYKYNQNAISLTIEGTENICENNGKEKMFECYSQIKPADALVYEPVGNEGNHVVMAVEDAKVVYNSDGSIDGKNSVIYIQDQRMGNFNYSLTFNVYEDGEHHHYSGNRHTPWSFNYLYKSGYIPVTCAEFTGDKPYQKAYAKENGTKKAKTFKELLMRTVSSNYNIITLNAEISDKNGKEVLKDRYITNSAEIKQGRCNSVSIKSLLGKKSVTEKLKKGNEYKIKITSLVATGQTFTVLENDVIYE